MVKAKLFLGKFKVDVCVNLLGSLGTLQGLRSPSCSSVTFTLQVFFFIFFLDHCACVCFFFFFIILHSLETCCSLYCFSGISFSSARNYYDVLGVSPKASREEIKKSFHEVSHCS